MRAQVAPASIASSMLSMPTSDCAHRQRATHTTGEQQLEDATLLLQARRTDTVGRGFFWRRPGARWLLKSGCSSHHDDVELLETLQPPSDAVVGGYPEWSFCLPSVRSTVPSAMLACSGHAFDSLAAPAAAHEHEHQP